MQILPFVVYAYCNARILLSYFKFQGTLSQLDVLYYPYTINKLKIFMRHVGKPRVVLNMLLCTFPFTV